MTNYLHSGAVRMKWLLISLLILGIMATFTEPLSAQNKVASGNLVYRFTRSELSGYFQPAGIGSERNTQYPGPFESAGENQIRPGSTRMRLHYVRNDTLREWGTDSQIPDGIPLQDELLSFWENYTTESGYDNVVVEISDDGGSTSSYLRTSTSGSSGGWTEFIQDITSYAGQTINLLFRFTSDTSIFEYGGWYIDDLSVLIE